MTKFEKCYKIYVIKDDLGEINMKNEETKRERFVRVAESRTNKILNMVQLLGNCSNASTYEYSTEDIEKIFNAIDFELKEAKKKFNKVDSKKGSKFTLN